MPTLYRFQPGLGHFTVQATATGMLAMLGHSPTFAIRDYEGTVRVDGPEGEGLGVELTIRAESLELLDEVKASDRREIVDRMHREVLETSRYPEIGFETVETASDLLAPGRFKSFLGGRLTLHGQTRRFGLDAEIASDADRIRLIGECSVKISDHGIGPVKALGGAIRLEDRLMFRYDLVAMTEAT